MTYRSYLLPKLQDINAGQQGMAEILSGLYVGNFRDSKDSKQLDIHRITHILSIHDDAKKLFKDKKYLIISAADSPKQDLIQFVPHCNNFIHAARLRGGHVLIHCLAGISRSVTIAAAYIICVTGVSVAEALQIVRSSRTIANPNVGFQKQLYDFQASGSAHKERNRLLEIYKAPVSGSSSPVAVPGRIIQPKAHQTSPWGGDADSMESSDRYRAEDLLVKYRQLIEQGDLCAGDCPNDGVSCSTGVCRAHLRSTSSSFLRRGASSSNLQRKPSNAFNMWCPRGYKGNDSPMENVRRHLIKVKSDSSLPSSPMFSRNQSMMASGDQRYLQVPLSRPFSASVPGRDTMFRHSMRHSSVSDWSETGTGSVDDRQLHHATWAATTTAIRATQRFDNRPGSPRTRKPINGR